MNTKKRIIRILKEGGIGVLPTDTIYGLVGSALSSETVDRIYRLRRRNLKKPMIILVSSLRNLGLFGVKMDSRLKKKLLQFWPGKISIILPCTSRKFFYLHRGKKSLAFRLPAWQWLRNLLMKTGPLVAPSANFEGLKPAKNIKEAEKYFGSQVDFYLDKGELVSSPSNLIKMKNNEVIARRLRLIKASWMT